MTGSVNVDISLEKSSSLREHSSVRELNECEVVEKLQGFGFVKTILLLSFCKWFYSRQTRHILYFRKLYHS